MLIQRKIKNTELAEVLQNIDEKDLLLALELFLQKDVPQLLKVGKHKPFKPFKAVKMKGTGPTASQMVVQDRN